MKVLSVGTLRACGVKMLCVYGWTWDAAVGDDKELGVAARVGEPLHADIDRTAASPGTGAVQQELNVDVTVPRERHVALGGHARVVAAVAGTVERQQPVVGVGCLARDLQHAVETGVCRPHDVAVIYKVNWHHVPTSTWRPPHCLSFDYWFPHQRKYSFSPHVVNVKRTLHA